MTSILSTDHQSLVGESVNTIRRKLGSLFGFSDKALGRIESYLFNRCIDRLAPTLALKLAALPSVIDDTNRVSPLMTSHPFFEGELARLALPSDALVEEMARHAIAFSTASLIQAFERLAKHRKYRDHIEDIRIHDGETHNGGGQVIVVYFREDILVYKPIDLRAQRFFSEVCRDIFATLGMGGEGGPRVVVAEPQYGVMEYIEPLCSPLSTDICKQFYFRAGVLLALAHCLKVVDIHYDNFFMTAQGPMILDVETLFYPFQDEYIPSIQDTLMVGHNKWSGIYGGGSLNKIGVHAQQTSNGFTVKYISPYFSTQNRIPSEQHPPHIDPILYRDDVNKGFQAGYEAIDLSKDTIFETANQLLKNNIGCRYIIRDTLFYLVKQLNLSQPKNMGKSKNLQRIKSAFLRSLARTRPDAPRIIVTKEMQDLLNSDVPYFYTKSLTRHLYHGSVTFPRFFVFQGAMFMLPVFPSSDRLSNHS